MKKTAFKKSNTHQASAKGVARLAKREKLENNLRMALYVYEERLKEEAKAFRRTAEETDSSNSGLF